MEKTEYLEKQLDELKDELKENSNCRVELEKSIVAIEQSMKSFHKRMDKVEETIEILRDVAVSIKSISEKVEKTVCLLESHDSRIGILEKTPGELLKKYAGIFIGAFLTGLAGFYVSHFIKIWG